MPDFVPDSSPLHPLGYLRHWLVTGPHETPYDGPIKDEKTLRREGIDFGLVTPPDTATLGGTAPFGAPWRFHYPGQNIFVELSDFWVVPTQLDAYAFTEIEAERDDDVAARFWVAGGADLWVNDRHITRFNVPRYMYPDFQAVILPLKKGLNRICVRLQALAIRDTRMLFGLQVTDPGARLVTRVPGASVLVDPAHWLDGVHAGSNDALSVRPAPCPAEIIFTDGTVIPWSAGAKHVPFGTARPFQFTVKVTLEGQTLSRSFEIPANRNGLPNGIPTDLHRAHLEYTASAPDDGFSPGVNYSHLPLLARRVLGQASGIDARAFPKLISVIDERHDCADFVLAVLLRLEWLGLATKAESEEIKRAALAFRYWDDEEGHDGMCFWSENHSLLFHGCQVMAGRLWPKETFPASKRIGEEQVKIGRERIRAWLDKIEPQGLGEFLSGTYIPITAGALLNVVDFVGDESLSRRAAAQIDRVYWDLADHAFKGLIIGPQGRVYRGVLYPEEAGTQTLLSFATPEATPDFSKRGPKPKERPGDWTVFLATSKTYRPPLDLPKRMSEPLSKSYRQGEAEIILHKTPSYILSSLAVPSTDGLHGLQPGSAGYQQHLWQATLGIGCHIFVTHPGGIYDVDKSPRPGYWFGNGVLPMLRQRQNVLQAIFDIPDGTWPFPARTQLEWDHPLRTATQPYDLHPVPFTHIHWPSDAFDHHEHRGHWLFGQKGDGCIAVWCSEKLVPHDDMLTRREYRANAPRAAWTGICGSVAESGSFEAFIEACQSRVPVFDAATLTLQMTGQESLVWSKG